MNRRMNHFMKKAAGLGRTRLAFMCFILLFLFSFVSCTPEVKSAKKVAVVRTSLGTNVVMEENGTLEEKTFSQLNITKVTYILRPLWDTTQSDSEVSYGNGETRTITGEALTKLDGGTALPLGYLTQGYWELTVYAYTADSQTTPAFSAVDIEYISNADANSAKFNVTLIGNAAPQAGKVSFKISAPVVTSDMAQKARVTYTITKADGSESYTGTLSCTTPTDANGLAWYVGEYASPLDAGYYYVQTSFEELRDGTDADWIHAGGTATKIYNNNGFEVTKNLKAADYVGLNINVVPADEITCTVKKGETTGSAEVTASDTAVDFTCTLGQSVSGTVQYSWYVNGTAESSTSNTLSKAFATAGYYSVTCVVVVGDSATSNSFYVTAK